MFECLRAICDQCLMFEYCSFTPIDAKLDHSLQSVLRDLGTTMEIELKHEEYPFEIAHVSEFLFHRVLIRKFYHDEKLINNSSTYISATQGC